MQQKETSPILFYDGDCGLCNRAVGFILKHEKNNQLKFASLQSEYALCLFKAKAPQLQDVNSLVLYNGDEFYIKSKAVIRLSKYLKSPFSWTSVIRIFPTSFLDWCYDIIARNRQRYFKNNISCELPDIKTRTRIVK